MTAAPQPGPLGVPAVWDAIANTYAKDVAPFFAKYAEEALRLVKPDATSSVLDVASGPGTLTFLAAPRVARVCAIDFSPGMVEELRARAASQGVHNVDAQVMDAQSLGFADATFDAAFCIFAFMFIPDRARAFGEIHRVLRPGGKVAVATWAPIERRPFIRVGFEAMAETFPELPPMPKGDLQVPEACIAEMTAGGFVDVVTHPFTAAARVDSAEHYLQIMERSGAGFAAVRKRIGEEAWPRAYARLIDAVRRRIPEGGAELSAEAILSIGSRRAS
jgi:ubiquinone/menaquinone biosynthesis C-methylase UbiE